MIRGVKRVLLALDGSEISMQVATRAADLLGPNWDYLLFEAVRVAVPMAVGASAWAPSAPTVSPEMILEMTERGRREAMVELSNVAARIHVDAGRRVEAGEPGASICRVAEDERVDLIVVGSHGKGFAKRAVLGSVSSHVVHHAHCPVLVIPVLEAPSA